MEEASVAGESPDSSKQRESSEEPTSGSAGPVPEARTEASETRDPRLAVAREDAKRSGGAGAGSRGGVDTATRVLSVRETEAESSGGDDDAGAPGAADTASDTPEKPEEPASGTDGRLRDAVAAWVATADERAAANARLDGTRDAAEPARDGERTETAAQAEDGGADPQPGGVPGATDSDTAPAEDSDDTESTAPDSDTDPGADAGADSDAAPAPGPGNGSGTGSGADSASDADETSGSGPASGPDTASDSRADTGSDADTTADAGADAAPAPGPGDSSGTGSGADSAADADEDETSGSGSGPASGTGAGADSGSGTDAGTVSGSGSGPVADSGPAPESDADSEPVADAGAEPGSGDGADPAPKPKPASDADPEPGSDAKARGESGSDAESGQGSEAKSVSGADAKAPSGREGDGQGGDGGDDREPPVDQPTAVFKAPRLGGPAVDQPTTMLKLGDAAAASKKAEQAEQAGKAGKAGPTAGPGDDAERTSKFVALRNPDDPANRKPPRAPETPGTPQGTAPPAGAPKASQPPRTGVTAARSHVGPDRTSQQPLPPKPPLDLLAELTNTPPPPETPLRTTVRRVKIWTPLVVLLLIVFGVVQAMRPLPATTLDLTAQDSFTFEGGKPEIPWPSSGQAALDVQGIGTFGSSGDQKPVPIASVAKVMTAYVILRDHPLKSGAEGPKIKIDQAAEDQSQAGQESTVNVFEGDSISQREALESILIASANNVARLLARWDAGSEKAFVEKMNAAAKDLGMTNTTYTDPSGLNNTTVSTAVDQVKLAKEAMKQPAFREVAAMMSYDDYKGVNHSNWNHLVGHNDVVGIKTGTTTSALGNLVFAAKKEVGGETKTIVGAVVRQPAGGADNTILGAALDSSDKLIRAAQDTLKSSTILKKGTVVGYVDDGLGGRTPVVATKDVKAVGWAGLTVKLTFTADEVPHTAQAGTKVGTLTVGDGGTSGAVKVPVALRDDLVEPGLSDKLTRLG
ncbi:D-alanyl-D-alanine carboxypeptidase [Streptomyces sp. AD681]|uniref:D-alanyl-D-alanine carboxypeptidase n=1 Tax=Streptomyces sp. AD681 TaxID=3019069 RepID=UPI0022F161E8|nr:D-alanyl-D-alanine carboxypeptidase [Streptomyces sp. AD681]MDA5147145.1 D-alanyl-D-alanine carboxypeptidase [Streptomyces sp. AD681]